MKSKIIIPFILIVVVFVVGIFSSNFSTSKKPQFVTTEVEAVVERKQYSEIYRYTHGPNSQRARFEHYLVTLKYCSISQNFDNEGLFESVDEGSAIVIKLLTEFDDDGKLTNQYLALTMKTEL